LKRVFDIVGQAILSLSRGNFVTFIGASTSIFTTQVLNFCDTVPSHTQSPKVAALISITVALQPRSAAPDFSQQTW
jgi:hypothetical protein